MNNWAVLAIAAMALLKTIVNLTPSEKDNAVFGVLDTIITAIVGNRKKKK